MWARHKVNCTGAVQLLRTFGFLFIGNAEKVNSFKDYLEEYLLFIFIITL